MVQKQTQEFIATGKRKSSVARVRMRAGTGKVIINGKAIEEFFGRATLPIIVQQPLLVTEQHNAYDVRANVQGGGITGQAEAIRHGIARALITVDPEFRKALKSAGFLTRDPRIKERKKYGHKKARKSFQFSKR